MPAMPATTSGAPADREPRLANEANGGNAADEANPSGGTDWLAGLRTLRPGWEGAASRVGDDASIALPGSAPTVRLAGLWPDRAATATGATAMLRTLVQGRRLRLYFDRQDRDRFGDWVAQAMVYDDPAGRPIWLQGELLRRGLARVYTTPGTETLAPAMLAAEGAARATGTGLWADPAYAVLPADRPERIADGFRVVEGRVQAVAVTAKRIYLNFGDDWRHDFTLTILRQDAARFPGRLAGLRALTGQRIRVRGWVFRLNGPAIRADHGGLIEILED
jgi:micrococcal nuclease